MNGFLQNINPFQYNFSANRILPSAYLSLPFPTSTTAWIQCTITCSHQNIWPAEKQKEYNLRICWPKSVLHEEKHQTGSDSRAGATKTCQTSSDIGVEQENHNVGRGPTQDRKGLTNICISKKQQELLFCEAVTDDFWSLFQSQSNRFQQLQHE
jgi:hypothetical protein